MIARLAQEQEAAGAINSSERAGIRVGAIAVLEALHIPYRVITQGSLTVERPVAISNHPRAKHAHWFAPLAGSARRHAFHVFARKSVLCRGPELNRRHMVLQVMRRVADENPSDLPAPGIWSRDARTWLRRLCRTRDHQRSGTRTVIASPSPPAAQRNVQHPPVVSVGISETYPVTGPCAGNVSCAGVAAHPAVRETAGAELFRLRAEMVISRGATAPRFAHRIFNGASPARSRTRMPAWTPKAPP